MFRVIILYAPDEKIINTTAHSIGNAFQSQKCVTTVKAARNALIPDIAGSDIVILGSGAEGKNPVHSEYKEIIRALKGINLAGRIAGIFTFDMEATADSFRQALGDSDITVYNTTLSIKDGQDDPSAITEWAKKIFSYYKDGT